MELPGTRERLAKRFESPVMPDMQIDRFFILSSDYQYCYDSLQRAGLDGS